MMTEVNSDRDFQRYRETVGIETAEALAAQGLEEDTVKSDDSRGMYIGGLSELKDWYRDKVISRRTLMENWPVPTQTEFRQQRRSPR